MRYEGIVFKVYSKTFKGVENYSIKLDGQPLYHRAGPKRFAGIAESGNRIAFDAEPNSDGQSTKITSDPVPVRAEPVAASGTPSAGGSYGDRNNSIVYQSSRKDALEFVTLAVANGALKLPKTQTGILATLETALDRYTALFFEDVNTLGAVLREAEGGAEPAKVEAEAEADDGE